MPQQLPTDLHEMRGLISLFVTPILRQWSEEDLRDFRRFVIQQIDDELISRNDELMRRKRSGGR